MNVRSFTGPIFSKLNEEEMWPLLTNLNLGLWYIKVSFYALYSKSKSKYSPAVDLEGK